MLIKLDGFEFPWVFECEVDRQGREGLYKQREERPLSVIPADEIVDVL